jgi:hypothetical protein
MSAIASVLPYLPHSLAPAVGPHSKLWGYFPSRHAGEPAVTFRVTTITHSDGGWTVTTDLQPLGTAGPAGRENLLRFLRDPIPRGLWKTMLGDGQLRPIEE